MPTITPPVQPNQSNEQARVDTTEFALELLRADKAVVAQSIGQLNIQAGSSRTITTLPFTVPKLIDTFVNRPGQFSALKYHLLNRKKQGHGPKIVALQGGGGFGKTILAQAMAYTPDIRKFFPDGVFWIELGQEPDLLSLVIGQIKLLDSGSINFIDLNMASAHLRQLLNQRRVLLILDDVWNEAHTKPFLPNSSSCACLLTTRRQDIVTWLRAIPVDVSEMKKDEASTLFMNWLDSPISSVSEFHKLAESLGKWPLLLELAAAYMRELIQLDGLQLRSALAELQDMLVAEGVSALDRATEGKRNKAISVSLEVSLKRLKQWRERYLELAIFPADAAIPIDAITMLWHSTAKLTEREVKEAIRAMKRLSLFNRYDSKNQTVFLHAIVHDYLNQQQSDNLSRLHHTFLEAYRLRLTLPQGFFPHSPITTQKPFSWADLPPEEEYLWEHLIHHLIGSQNYEALLEAVQNLRYLAAKIYHRSAYGLEIDLYNTRKYIWQLAQMMGVEVKAWKDYEARDDQPSQDDDPHQHIDSVKQTKLQHDYQVIHRLHQAAANAGQLFDKQVSLNSVANTLYSRLCHLPELESLTEKLVTDLTKPYFEPYHSLPNLPHPALLRTIHSHTLAITSCAYSPNGQTIVSGSLDSKLKIWDALHGQELSSLQGHRAPISSCTYSPDGHHILSASWDRTLKLWDAPTDMELTTLRGHTARVLVCAYRPDGLHIVSGSEDCTIKIWHADTGECLQTIAEHAGPVNAVTYDPSGQQILSASDDGTLKIWDAETGQCIHNLAEHTKPVLDAAYSPNGKYVLSASADRMAIFWSAANGQPILRFTEHRASVTSCGFSPDGLQILTASEDRTLRLRNIASDEDTIRLTGHSDRVRDFAYSPDGRHIVSAAGDDSLKIWDATVKHALDPQKRQSQTVHSCAYSQNEGETATQQMVAIAEDDTLKIWSVVTGQPLFILTTHDSEIHGCAYSPDNRRIVSASWDCTLKILDAFTGKCLHTLEGHGGSVESGTYSPDGQQILSASADQTLKVWDVETGQVRQTLMGHKAVVFHGSYSPDGRQILSASGDYTLKIWDAYTGNCLQTLNEHGRPVNSGAYSPDGKRIVSASDDHTLKIWDAVDGTCLQTLFGHGHWVTKGVYSPDGQYILSSSVDCTVRLWAVESGQLLATFVVDAPLYDCAFSADGLHTLAVGDGGVYFLKLIL